MINSLDFTEEAKQQDLKRLINQIWKLIPMRENEEDWENHLYVVIEEISGLTRIYSKSEGLILLSKLEGLTSRVCSDDFMVYRGAVFSCIDLLSRLFRDDG